MPKIEILIGEDVLRTRSLWEEVFAEDTKQFLDYYYAHKAQNNICFVIQEHCEILSMVHLTSYDVCVAKENRTLQERNSAKVDIFPSFYIVGVATKENYRHRGYMTALLERAFSYMRDRDIGFTFLMPANPAIYEPFGFRYIYERTDYQLRHNYLRQKNGKKEIAIRQAREEDCGIVASFAMQNLAKHYHFFLKRDSAYVQTLLMELESENGCMYLIYVGDKLVGYFTYACEEEAFIQEVLIEERYESMFVGEEGEEKLLTKKAKKKPIVMGKCLQNGMDAECFWEEIVNANRWNGFLNEVV